MAASPYAFILASASPRRFELLAQAGFVPDEVLPADIDESVQLGETPAVYALRVAQEKARVIAEIRPQALVLAADTVVAVGRRILPKAETEKQAFECLELLQGRRHRVYTAVAVRCPEGEAQRVCETRVRMSRLSRHDIERYVQSGQWSGKAGGYGIQGLAEAFIPWISGSYSNIVGLPLAEMCPMLLRFGLKPNGGAV